MTAVDAEHITKRDIPTDRLLRAILQEIERRAIIGEGFLVAYFLPQEIIIELERRCFKITQQWSEVTIRWTDSPYVP